jgi:hypothetical protein
VAHGYCEIQGRVVLGGSEESRGIEVGWGPVHWGGVGTVLQDGGSAARRVEGRDVVALGVEDQSRRPGQGEYAGRQGGRAVVVRRAVGGGVRDDD